jgi:hypothetical protein
MSYWEQALSAAHGAAERGFRVFPLSRRKLPALPSPHPQPMPTCRGACGRFGHGVHDATTDHRRLDALFAAAPWATAYGLACGQPPHYLLGLDLDVKDGVNGIADLRTLASRHHFTMPDTATVASPSGGLHHWLSAPPDLGILNSAREIAAGIDIRTTGGYLVGPGSLGTKGYYRFVPGTDPDLIAPAPAELLALLTPAPAPVAVAPDPERLRQGIHALAAYARAALNGECDKVRRTRQPGRKRRLFASAAQLARLIDAHALPQTVAYDALLTAGLACGLTAAECERNIVRGFARGSTTRTRVT